MKELKELIKKSFELRVKMAWLKTINKAVNERNKCYEKYQRKAYVVIALFEEYERKYGDMKKIEGAIKGDEV